MLESYVRIKKAFSLINKKEAALVIALASEVWTLVQHHAPAHAATATAPAREFFRKHPESWGWSGLDLGFFAFPDDQPAVVADELVAVLWVSSDVVALAVGTPDLLGLFCPGIILRLDLPPAGRDFTVLGIVHPVVWLDLSQVVGRGGNVAALKRPAAIWEFLQLAAEVFHDVALGDPGDRDQLLVRVLDGLPEERDQNLLDEPLMVGHRPVTGVAEALVARIELPVDLQIVARLTAEQLDARPFVFDGFAQLFT